MTDCGHIYKSVSVTAPTRDAVTSKKLIELWQLKIDLDKHCSQLAIEILIPYQPLRWELWTMFV